MLVNPNYKAGGGATSPQITIGGSFGNPLGDPSGSITVTTSGHIGETALFIVMHRDDITVDSSWEFVDKRTTVYDDSYTQYVSIYKKTIETSAEIYTITSTTAGMMYCTMYYSDKDIDIVYQQTLKMEKQTINGNDCAIVQIEPSSEILVVLNSPYASTNNRRNMCIYNYTVLPQYDDNSTPSEDNLPNARMYSFFTTQTVKMGEYPWDESMFTNADVFIYGIS